MPAKRPETRKGTTTDNKIAFRLDKRRLEWLQEKAAPKGVSHHVLAGMMLEAAIDGEEAQNEILQLQLENITRLLLRQDERFEAHRRSLRLLFLGMFTLLKDGEGNQITEEDAQRMVELALQEGGLPDA